MSRYHAVLQFKSQASPEKPAGFYLYDLDSTHGKLIIKGYIIIIKL